MFIHCSLCAKHCAKNFIHLHCTVLEKGQNNRHYLMEDKNKEPGKHCIQESQWFWA